MPCEIRTVAVAPGARLPYDPEEWRDALVIVARGEIVLEALDGGEWRFRRGHLLWLQDLPLAALLNRGEEPARLVAASRGVAS